MGTIQARPAIPAEWGRQASCPVCSAAGLSVIHQPGSPDRMLCRACGLAFSLELNGSRLRLAQLPRGLTGRPGLAVGAWLTAAELRSAARQPARSAPQPEPTPTAPSPARPTAGSQPSAAPRTVPLGPATLPQKEIPPEKRAELLKKIHELRSLGNSDARVREILRQTLFDPPELAAALELVDGLESLDQRKASSKLRTWLTVIIILVVFLVAVGLILQHFFVKPAAAPSTVSNAGIVEILKLATPIIHRSPTLALGDPKRMTRCPTSADEAASLFGGQAAYWKSEEGGWMMLNPAKSTTIYVPSGMAAAYMLMSQNLTLDQIMGPATMENVHYVAISCP